MSVMRNTNDESVPARKLSAPSKLGKISKNIENMHRKCAFRRDEPL